MLRQRGDIMSVEHAICDYLSGGRGDDTRTHSFSFPFFPISAHAQCTYAPFTPCTRTHVLWYCRKGEMQMNLSSQLVFNLLEIRAGAAGFQTDHTPTAHDGYKCCFATESRTKRVGPKLKRLYVKNNARPRQVECCYYYRVDQLNRSSP